MSAKYLVRVGSIGRCPFGYLPGGAGGWKTSRRDITRFPHRETRRAQAGENSWLRAKLGERSATWAEKKALWISCVHSPLPERGPRGNARAPRIGSGQEPELPRF